MKLSANLLAIAGGGQSINNKFIMYKFNRRQNKLKVNKKIQNSYLGTVFSLEKISNSVLLVGDMDKYVFIYNWIKNKNIRFWKEHSNTIFYA